jgi:hypothetical protein
MDLAVRDCEWRGGGSVALLSPKKAKWCSLTPPFMGEIEALMFVYRLLVAVGLASLLRVCRSFSMSHACLMLLLVVVWVNVVDGTGGGLERGLRGG